MDNYGQEITEGTKEVERYIRDNGVERMTKNQVQRLLRVGLYKASCILELLKNKGVLIEVEDCYRVIK